MKKAENLELEVDDDLYEVVCLMALKFIEMELLQLHLLKNRKILMPNVTSLVLINAYGKIYFLV